MWSREDEGEGEGEELKRPRNTCRNIGRFWVDLTEIIGFVHMLCSYNFRLLLYGKCLMFPKMSSPNPESGSRLDLDHTQPNRGGDTHEQTLTRWLPAAPPSLSAEIDSAGEEAILQSLTLSRK